MLRCVERDLIPDLIAYRGYRRARWQAVILYGLGGSGKTAIARSLADNERIKDAFRDGIAWLDGSCDPEEEITRLCQALQLARAPGERWIECWRRWAGAVERRFVLIVDDAVSAEGLPLLIAGLGSQVVVLLTTQQGSEVRGEVERWLPADAILEVGIHGLAPAEGRELVEMVAGRPLAEAEWKLVQEIGELIGWHPEALRLAAIEGREIGWPAMLGELRDNRMPWAEVNRSVMRQWTRLLSGQREWLTALVRDAAPGRSLAIEEAARFWQVEPEVAERRLWILEHDGLVESHHADQALRRLWRVVQVAHLSLGG